MPVVQSKFFGYTCSLNQHVHVRRPPAKFVLFLERLGTRLSDPTGYHRHAPFLVTALCMLVVVHALTFCREQLCAQLMSLFSVMDDTVQVAVRARPFSQR